MSKMFYAKWENVNEDSENYEDWDSATFTSLDEAREWLGDKLNSFEYDCMVCVDDVKHSGYLKIVLTGWLP